MEKLKSFIKHTPTYILVALGIVLLAVAHFSPRYVGLIPALGGMAVWFVVLGRTVGSSIDKQRPGMKHPWWTKL